MNAYDAAAARIAALREAINRHDRLYYVEARPVISDAEYDALWAELDTLEKAHPALITPDSPTQRVSGEPIAGFRKVRHDPPMRSLDKTYDKADLTAFEAMLRSLMPEASWDYVVEPKVDGLSVSLLYRGGRLVRAATRGNGEVGDDITANVRTIRSVPLAIPTDLPLVEVRGEIYMTREGFAALNRAEEEAGREPFANPRNAAAGSVKLLDPREVARRPLDAVLYALGSADGLAVATQLALTRQLAAWGFRTAPWQRLCMDIGQVLAAVDELEKLRHAFPFEIDGAVVKVNQLALGRSLGSTAHAPRSARAYKYAPETAETLLEGITVQVGRTGVLTPVAELRPVTLAGSVIARATLHNADMIREKDVRVGDTVIISKHGDVIPAVDGVVPAKRPPGARPYAMPQACPVCGAAVEAAPRPDGTGTGILRCVNPECPAQRVGRLQLFVSRDALDIAAIGGRMAEALVQAGLVTDPLDLYALRADALAAFPVVSDDGTERVFGRKAQDVLAALGRARTLPLHRWIIALGIPNIGGTVARLVAGLYPSFSAMRDTALLREIEAFYAVKDRRLSEVADRGLHAGEIISRAQALAERALLLRDDPSKPIQSRFLLTVKPETVRSLLRFLDSPYAGRLFARMAGLGIDPKPEAPRAAGGALAGKGFVITGTLSRPRAFFENLIRAHGGTVQSSVSGKTAWLLAGPDAGGSKLAKARSLGTALLDEAGFCALIGQDGEGASPPAQTPPPPPAPKAARTKPSAAAPAYRQDDLFGDLA